MGLGLGEIRVGVVVRVQGKRLQASGFRLQASGFKVQG